MFFDIETTGLDITKNKIISIQIKDGHGKKIWCIKDYKNEKELIKQFVDYYLNVKDKFLIGYNFTNLDLPLLFRRMKKEDLIRFFEKYNKGYVRDLAMILEFHKIKRQKLPEIAKLFQIDDTNNKRINVAKTYKEKKWEKIINYAEKELDTIEELFKKMWEQIKEFGHLNLDIKTYDPQGK
jgi:uncharacterized protein YprB with RNaseH-like and TPR domain